MSLYKEWRSLIDGQTKATIEKFWEEYAGAETRIYTDILEHHTEKVEGKFSDLAEKYETRAVIFMGFLDGINESLQKELDLETITEDSEISLDIDFEKLFLNMFKADADYLFSLDQWRDVLPEEKRLEIYKEYKKSKTYIAPEKIGRNDPCPCGSGKKYKKCCGK